ncbi:MAG TPA: MEDS domain-containing protein [Candidatus Thermoplasmatota archaeon]|nr:MEDS domain-containing protein [Candidatus Thermoplasmatota archaeon]
MAAVAGKAAPPRGVLDLRPGDHACILYDSEENHRAVFTTFVREGLARGERVQYIADAHSPQAILAMLRADGLDAAAAVDAGQLRVLGSDAYTPGGRFDPDEMIGALGAAVDAALDDGFDGLRGTGEMSWVLRSPPGADRVMEYEAKLNRFFPGRKFTAICQYDTTRLPGRLVQEALTTHPFAMLGAEVFDNFYYIEPDVYLGPQREREVTRRWMDNLRTHRRFQEERLRARLSQLELERLRTLQQLQTDFLNEAAHLFATPMTPLRLQIATLQRVVPRENEAAHERLRELDVSFGRLAATLHRVLQTARKQPRKQS